MKPAILVARAVFPEVLERLQAHFEVEANQEDVIFTPAELVAKLQGKAGVLTTSSARINAALLQQVPDLKMVANMAVGYDNIDLAACAAHSVQASNTPDVLNETTADFGWALMMATARRITEAEQWLRAGLWQKWRYDLFLGPDLHGSTLGILGMGRIGQAIARRSTGFNMQVIYHNRSPLAAADEAQANHARYVSKEELLKTADHLILVLPYSPASHHAIGAPELALMKPTATLVNLARGGIVDDQALITALREKRLAAAGLDVFENEPAFAADFLTLSNVVLTPHIASASGNTRRAMAHCAVDNLIAGLSGLPVPNLLRV
ncbi:MULTISPECIES: D-glycerate dehydrogenase [unclassified Undibacterium]|uniref:2-hydroxyacid dehydrogenase n=1 Tax=unclassified Undibacterium TaxID=2630295 RepID=UPI002AC9B27B|nr:MULTISPECIES: D-glycerate dehydrogenase [unclassified Undibacterium]MEB0140150.1 D-glycerate dehydrogenase [Undibacterium sp. CCC2.1]MEB0173582.1 D-glycerate dehydrogenase [Undibacterium sp. CCC1.1]MEB0177562.1 D-glycerate dehydrogenase [Undibacterium sp. CCC3.4]MEB0214435.1 D-glycerate dehydrogenase [Undibacterium sp. 5I2]WPX42832.1 D-glycerate dehydrogenase [Undibacterium sp. CCC3.4]